MNHALSVNLRSLRWALLLAVVGVGVGCRPADQATETMDARALREARESLSEAALAALDLGGEAFRIRDYAGALEHYRRAAELEPDEAAPWFGIYMAQRALGNLEAADSALARARSVAPGASLLRDSVP